MTPQRCAIFGLGLLLMACTPVTVTDTPLTMPPPDGREQKVELLPRTFIVNRRERGAIRPGISLRVTRLAGRDLTYSDAALAKQVADAYCATFNRVLNPRAVGRFSTPNSWVFDGDCL